jgi:hypothetical protein
MLLSRLGHILWYHSCLFNAKNPCFTLFKFKELAHIRAFIEDHSVLYVRELSIGDPLECLRYHIIARR